MKFFTFHIFYQSFRLFTFSIDLYWSFYFTISNSAQEFWVLAWYVPLRYIPVRYVPVQYDTYKLRPVFFMSLYVSSQSVGLTSSLERHTATKNVFVLSLQLLIAQTFGPCFSKNILANVHKPIGKWAICPYLT